MYSLKYILILITVTLFFGCSTSGSTVLHVEKKSSVMTGMYSYMADAAIFKDCSSGMKYPVTFEGYNLALERAYLKVRKTPAQTLKIELEGKIVWRDAMDKDAKVQMLYVERFINIIPNEVCQHTNTQLFQYN